MPKPTKGSYDKLRDAHDKIPAKDSGDKEAGRKIDKAIDKIDKSGRKGKGDSGGSSGGNYGSW